MTTFLQFIVKWWPVVSALLGLGASIVGTHNNAALKMGAEGSSNMGAPLVMIGAAAVVAACFGFVVNIHRASVTLPPPNTPVTDGDEGQLLGFLAQRFASKQDMRLGKLMDLYKDNQNTGTAGSSGGTGKQ